MHERTLVLALLQQVETIRENNAAKRVLVVNVSIGDFSGVEAELVQSAFAELSVSSAVEGAEIKIDRVPLECTCLACGCSTLVKEFCFECDHCRSRKLEIVRGEEMILESVTLEGADHE